MGNDSASSQVDIQINTRADVSGAEQAQVSLEGVENTAAESQTTVAQLAPETEAAAASAAELTRRVQDQRAEMMRTVFQAHRLMEGFKDLSEGGRLASQGMVDIEETLARFLPPMAQVGLAIASAIGLLAMMATRHRHAAGEAKEHADAEKEAAEETKQAWTEANDVLAGDLKKIEDGKFWAGQLEQAKELTAEINAQATALTRVQSAEDALTTAKKEQQLADLNLREQRELEGKTGDETEDIKQRYAAEREGIEAVSKAQHDQAEIDRARAQQQHDERLAAAQRLQTEAATRSAQVAFDAAHAASSAVAYDKSDYSAARDRLEELQDQQANVGKEGENGVVKPLTPAQLLELQNLQGGLVENLRQKEVQAGRPLFDEQVKAAKKQLADIQTAEDAILAGSHIEGKTPEEQNQIIAQWGQQVSDLRQFLLRVATYENAQKQVLDASAMLGKAQKEQQDFDAQQPSIILADRKRLEATQGTLAADTTNAQGKTQQEVNQSETEATKRSREARDNELDARVATVEANLKIATEDAAKKILEDQLARLKVEGLRNKETDELAGVTDPALRKSIIDRSNAEIAGVGASNTATDRKIDQQDARQNETRERSQIMNLAGQIEATGNKAMIEALHRVVDAFKGKTDEASQLAELSQLTGVLAGNYAQFQTETTAHLQRLEGTIKSLRTNRH